MTTYDKLAILVNNWKKYKTIRDRFSWTMEPYEYMDEDSGVLNNMRRMIEDELKEDEEFPITPELPEFSIATAVQMLYEIDKDHPDLLPQYYWEVMQVFVLAVGLALLKNDNLATKIPAKSSKDSYELVVNSVMMENNVEWGEISIWEGKDDHIVEVTWATLWMNNDEELEELIGEWTLEHPKIFSMEMIRVTEPLTYKVPKKGV